MKKKQKSETIQIETKKQIWPWIILLLAVVFVTIIRIRLLNTPLERDEGEYAYAGQLILQKIPPYSMAYNMKLPGMYFAYALIMALFGQTIAGIHLGFLLVNIATIILLFLLTRRLLDDKAAAVAASSYAVLSVSSSVIGISAHATHFVMLPVTGGCILLLKAVESSNKMTFLWSGLLFGLGFLMKQHAIFFIIFGIIYAYWGQIKVRPGQYRPALAGTVIFAAAASIPFLLTCLILYKLGVFEKFWFWTFEYARRYVTQLRPEEALSALKYNIPRVLKYSAFLWVLGLIGLVLLSLKNNFNEKRPFIIGFLVFSIMSVCPGWYFRQHYFVQMLPALCILIGAAVSISIIRLKDSEYSIIKVFPALIFIAAVISTIGQQSREFFILSPIHYSRNEYLGNPFTESIEIAKYLESHTDREDKILVFGSEPEIYFYSDRHSATGFLYTYPMMERQEFALTMQEEMIEDIKQNQPKYIVYVKTTNSWVPLPESNQMIIRWFNEYRPKYYDRVGVIMMESVEKTYYYWDSDAEDINPTSAYVVYVYRRKAL